MSQILTVIGLLELKLWVARNGVSINIPSPEFHGSKHTSNGSWRQGIKGEMTCTVYVVLVWNITYWIMMMMIIIIINNNNNDDDDIIYWIMMIIMIIIIMRRRMTMMIIGTTTIMIMIIIITMTIMKMIMINTAQTPCQSLYKDRRI